MSEENISFEELLNNSMKDEKLGKVVEGTIIGINKNEEIIVDLKYKADGIIPKEEYSFDENEIPSKELKIGDNVFIASKKDDCITFAHYKMISVEATNNCELIFSRRIYDYSKPDLPKIVYKNFFKDFLRRHDL